MEWLLILMFLLTVVGAVLACQFLNRRLFSLMRKAENEVRHRCMQRPKLGIETIVDSFGVCQHDRCASKEILTGIARVMKVPPETLRSDDRFGNLCLVQFSADVSVKPNRLIAFSHDLLDFISQSLSEEQYIDFLSALGVANHSEDVIWGAISERPLSDVVCLMTKAIMGSSKV